MSLECYRCKELKSQMEDFSPSKRIGPRSQVVCKKCRAAEKRKERDADPKMKWGRFVFKKA